MMSEKFIHEQMNRIASLRSFPDNDQGYEDLVIAFRGARSEEAVEKFITAWKRSNQFAPTPADIYAASGAPEEITYWKTPEPTRCNICGDTGWKQVVRGEYSGVTECECRTVGTHST